VAFRGEGCGAYVELDELGELRVVCACLQSNGRTERGSLACLALERELGAGRVIPNFKLPTASNGSQE
jgi:hypothetical protein